MGVILADPGPYPFETKCKAKFHYFPENFTCNVPYCAVSNIENYNTYDAAEKDKTMSTGTALNTIQNFYMIFQYV
jgi:hypothetical protein